MNRRAGGEIMRCVTGVSRRQLLARVDGEIALRSAAPGLAPALLRRWAPSLGSTPIDAEAPAVDPARMHALAALALARFAGLEAGASSELVEASARASIDRWVALGAQGPYLDALARRMLGRPEPHVAELAMRIGMDAVGSRLEDDVRAGRDAGALLRALDALAATGGPLAGEARRLRMSAVDRAIDPLRRALDELATRRPTTDELVAAFAAARASWRCLDRDVDVEVLVVERLPDFAWDLYRQRANADLARILDEAAEPSSSLAARVERAEALAWAAPCAQVLVFRAELAPRFDAQVELAERALRCCPTLRNARIVLGDFLLTRAERALDRRLDRTSAGTSPEQDVARAAELHPELKRLPIVRGKLRRAGAPP